MPGKSSQKDVGQTDFGFLEVIRNLANRQTTSLRASADFLRFTQVAAEKLLTVLPVGGTNGGF